jgi:hypothetical protein
MYKYCTQCNQRPELMHTGKSPGEPQWYCVACGQEYYVDKDGSLCIEPPFKWPQTNNKSESYEIKNGHWKKV